MIIENKAAGAAQTPALTADLPPAYDDHSYHPLQPTSASATSAPRASNLIVVKRDNGSITGAYVIDPTLAIPESLLPPLDAEETRKNLSLYCQYAPIDVDVTILPKNHGRKVTISVTSSHSSVKCKLDPSKHRSSSSPPISIEGRSEYGPVKVLLPRSFHGPVSASTVHGVIKVSDAVAAHQTTFSDINKTRKFFIGDVSRYIQQEGMDWDGDEAVVESTFQTIKVYYEDEVRESRGLFEKFWDSITL